MNALISFLLTITKVNKTKLLTILFAAIGVLQVATEALKTVASAIAGAD